MRSSLVIILTLVLSACVSSRKATTKTETASVTDSATLYEHTAEKHLLRLDTAFSKDIGITITEVEYFSPSTPLDFEDSPAPAWVQDQTATNASCEKPPFGAVKRWRQVSIGASVKQEGHAMRGDSLSTERQCFQKRESGYAASREQATAKSTLHWRYYAITLCAIALFYIAREPILNMIRKILAGLRRTL